MTRKHPWLLVSVLSLIYFCGLLYFSQIRGVDPDEGFYPTAARLAWEGKVPYRDFMFSQGPFTAYAYSWIWGIHPQSLVALRVLSVTLGAVSVLLWGLFLVSLERLPKRVAWMMFALILLNPYWISSHTMFKTFALADFLMTVAMICLYFGIQSGGARWYAPAGVALGLCASSRALYGPLAVFVFVWLARLDWRESARRFPRALPYLAGAACGLVPMLLSFAADPAAFVFNNFRYRRILDSYLTASFTQSLKMHAIDLYYVVQRRYFAMELLLALLGVAGLLLWRKRKDRPHTPTDVRYLQLAFLMGAVYTMAALIPLPTFAQYLDGPLLPFMVLFMAEGMRVAFRINWKFTVLAFTLVTPIIFYRGVRSEVAEFSSWPRLQLSSYRKVAEIVRSNSAGNATVLSIWPGYVFESGRRYFPGAENQFVYAVAAKVTPEERARFHLVSRDEVLRALADGVPDIYIPAALGRYIHLEPGDAEIFQKAAEIHYALAGTVDDVPVYRKVR